MSSFEEKQKSEIKEIIKTEVHAMATAGGKCHGYKERNEKTLSVKELKDNIDVLRDKERHGRFITKSSKGS